ncbi:MAG: glycosyltransferase family 4 protein [Candidatus Sumerlaeia bacterium]|nr:glycosyltransferase family 4 protein [Candidatus Sumerlaeia bacterium]
MTAPVWHLWFPEWRRSPGGIQRTSNALHEAIRRLDPAPHVHIFVKNDLPSDAGGHGTTFGAWPPGLRTLAFCLGTILSVLRKRPALIITTHANFTPLARVIGMLFGTRYWVLAHGIEVWGPPTRRLRFGLRGADRILCVSRFTRDRVHHLYRLPKARFRVLPNTFDTRRFRPMPANARLRARLGISPDARILLTVARIAASEHFKGYDRVLHALPRVLEQVPNAVYVLAGGGDDRARVQREADSLGVGHAVRLPGYIPELELADLYNLCDVYVMPSRKEGFGIVFLEALGCGKPVIAGNADGSVEPLADGQLGILVDPDDVNAIADALVNVLAASHLDRHLLDSAWLRREVVRRFGERAFRRRLARIVEEQFG